MPTGYTHPVQEGKVTELREFAMQCARAFGACVEMRDDPSDKPIPLRFEPRTAHHDNRLADANALLAKLPNMTSVDCEAAAEDEYQKALASWHERKIERALHRQRYEAMVDKIRVWQPPQAVMNLKGFMVQQLLTSIDHDCSDKYDDEPKRQSADEWLQDEIKSARRDIAYHSAERAKTIASTEEANLWLDALRISLL